jgi:hypothetical protein
VAAPTPTSEGRAIRVLVAVPVVLVTAIAAGYLAIIESQDGPREPTVLVAPFIAGFLGLMAFLLLLSLLGARPIVTLRPALRAASGAGLLVLGGLAIFSIGLPILFTAAPAIAALVITISQRPAGGAVLSAAAAAVVTVALLFAGLEFTWHYLVCPPAGLGAGTTPGIFVRGYSYECSYGHLTINK